MVDLILESNHFCRPSGEKDNFTIKIHDFTRGSSLRKFISFCVSGLGLVSLGSGSLCSHLSSGWKLIRNACSIDLQGGFN